jgi:hypothetical protein
MDEICGGFLQRIRQESTIKNSKNNDGGELMPVCHCSLFSKAISKTKPNPGHYYFFGEKESVIPGTKKRSEPKTENKACFAL